MSDIDRLDVEVDAAPHPGLLRPTLEAALAGRATGSGPEASIAHAVRDAVSAHIAGGGPRTGAGS